MKYFESFWHHGYIVTYTVDVFGGYTVLIKAHLANMVNSYRCHVFSSGTEKVTVNRYGNRSRTYSLKAAEMPPRVRKMIARIIEAGKELDVK